MWPWAPVVDTEIRKPSSSWYDGWEEKDWSFLPDIPHELIRMRQFNPAIRYMAGLTADEAAYIVCKSFFQSLPYCPPIQFVIEYSTDNNKSLLPNFEVNEQFFDQKIREYIHRFNYTLNPDGIYKAIKYMYTYWPDPKNLTHIREQFIHVMWLHFKTTLNPTKCYVVFTVHV